MASGPVCPGYGSKRIALAPIPPDCWGGIGVDETRTDPTWEKAGPWARSLNPSNAADRGPRGSCSDSDDYRRGLKRRMNQSAIWIETF